MHFIDDCTVIWGYNDDLPLIEKTYIYKGEIIPNRMIKQKCVYEITRLNPMFYINGFSIITSNTLVETITLFGHHPNRDPSTHLYCLPDYKKGIKFDEQYFEMLLTNIKTYYLDDCFLTPGKHADYKKLSSIYMERK